METTKALKGRIQLLFAIACFLLSHYCCGAFLLRSTTKAFFRRQALVSSSSSSVVPLTGSSEIEENIEDDDEEAFERSCALHTTIQNLRSQLPYLLSKPLTQSSTETVYSDDFEWVVSSSEEDIVLLNSREELISLSNALVLLLTVQGDVLQRSDPPSLDKSRIYLDPSLKYLQVEWKTSSLLSIDTSPFPLTAPPRLEGLSRLEFDDRGKICMHRLLQVRFVQENDDSSSAVDASSIAGLLATLRSGIRNVRQLPFNDLVEASFVPLLEWRDEFLQRHPVAAVDALPELYVLEKEEESINATNRRNNATSIRDYEQRHDAVALPGSTRWEEYASSRTMLKRFVQDVIPQLATTTNDETKNLFFAAQAEWIGVDGTLLLRGGDRISKIYQTMASLRKDWNMANATTNWKTRTVTIRYEATTTTVDIQGTDCFVLDNDGMISKIKQVRLVVGGARVISGPWVKQVITAMESGRSSAGGEFLVELLQRLPISSDNKNKKNGMALSLPLRRSDTAAATVYNIMASLHSDWQTILATDSNGMATAVPAQQFMTDTIELRGYLGETLARGKTQHNRSVGMALSTLKTALRTGRIKFKKVPRSKVELTTEGHVRCSLTLDLQLSSAFPGPPMDSPALRLDLVSLYKTDATGRIYQQRLEETRVNGRLTPADVVTRWMSGNLPGTPTGTSDAMRVFRDIYSWVSGNSSSPGNNAE